MKIRLLAVGLVTFSAIAVVAICESAWAKEPPPAVQPMPAAKPPAPAFVPGGGPGPAFRGGLQPLRRPPGVSERPFVLPGSNEMLPIDARELVEAFEKKVNDAEKRIEEEMRKEKLNLMDRLRKVMEEYCKQCKLDEALAVREQIRGLRNTILNVQPFNGAIAGGPENVGKSFTYEVVGRPGGSVWGTDIYTTDSSLQAVVVHSGLLRDGEKGVVRVIIIEGQQSYTGTTRNGITTGNWGPYPTSYRVELLRY